jgi:hypothetical protein
MEYPCYCERYMNENLWIQFVVDVYKKEEPAKKLLLIGN